VSFDVTSVDDGWREIATDPNAPQDGYCLLANKDKTIAWESHSGIGFKMPLGDPAYWWKPGGSRP
jgi:hypothetical protein